MRQSSAKPLHLLVFCRVIDNYGDAGVCWRLCRGLALRGHHVRLYIDQPDLLAWMAPVEERPKGIEVFDWSEAKNRSRPSLHQSQAPDVVIEAFGCGLPQCAVNAMLNWQAQGCAPLWINLEYLSAESYVERSHLLPSPQVNGLQKTFFYPGFTPRTGGLLRPDSLGRQSRRDWVQRFTPEWAALVDAVHGAALGGASEYWVCLFCYEPPVLAEALRHLGSLLAQQGKSLRIWVCHGRSSEAAKAAFALKPASTKDTKVTKWPLLHYLPALTQTDFDALLNLCDLNFVRGEDSLAQAVQLGKPFVWHTYPQDDEAHKLKLEAFLDSLNLSQSSRLWHLWWNGLLDVDCVLPDKLPIAVKGARLHDIPDLVEKLERTAYLSRLV